VDDPLASDVLFPGYLPVLSDCGEPGVPLFDLGDSVTLPDGHLYACVDVGSATDATIGLHSTHGGTEDEPDLRFTLHLFDALGDPVAVGHADDTVGTDPELTLGLDQGTYLVDLDAFGAATGVVVVYTETA